MMWDILPDMAWKSAVTLGVTLALLQTLKRRSAAQRAWIAHIGLIATLLLPVAAVLLPRWEVAAAAPMAELAAPMTMIFAAAPPLPQVAAPAAVPTPMIAMPDPATLLAWGWLLPALALLAAMLVAVMRLFALRNRATVLVEQSWLTALAQAQARMNFKHGTALLVSREIASPVSWGVVRPVILINQASVAKAGDAEAIIAHELAHVSRLDWAGLLLARIATALFWFNPLVWMVARQAHQLREEAADDAVLRSNVDRVDYAALLVGAARHEAHGFLLAANGVAPSAGSLKRRITRVLDEHQLRAPAYLGWMSACVLGAGVVALPLAAFSATRPVEIVQAVEAAFVAAPQVIPSVAPTPSVQITQAPAMPHIVPVSPMAPVPSQADRVTVNIPGISIQTAPQSIDMEHSLQAFALEQAARALETMGHRDGAIAARAAMRDRIMAQAAPAIAPVSPVEATPPANGEKPDADELIQMTLLGIPPEYRQEIARAGYGDLKTGQLQQLRIHGVTGPWLRDLAAVGYDRLSLKQITNFAIHRVDADFALRMRRMASAQPSPEQLVQLRIFNAVPPHENKDKNKNFD